jgi:hypothetical protein
MSDLLVKRITLLAILSTGFFSCKKDNAQPDGETETLTTENASVIVAGNLVFSSETNTGLVKIYLQQNGKYLLALEKIDCKVSSTSFVVYLSPSNMTSSSSIKIFSGANLDGNIFHALPANLDLTFFKYLIIQAEHSEESIASAELS